MPFLGDDSWKRIGATTVDPFNPQRIKHGAYELSMGGEYYVTSTEGNVKTVLKENEIFSIPPGQMALLITKESVSLGPNHVGFISVKAGKKFYGLINISGFHVDPGFHGKLKFSVYNAGSRPIPLEEGQPTFMLWLGTFDDKCSPYDGDHMGQERIDAKDVYDLAGELPSPLELKNQIGEIKTYLNLLVIPVILLFLGVVVQTCMDWPTKSGQKNDHSCRCSHSQCLDDSMPSNVTSSNMTTKVSVVLRDTLSHIDTVVASNEP